MSVVALVACCKGTAAKRGETAGRAALGRKGWEAPPSPACSDASQHWCTTAHAVATAGRAAAWTQHGPAAFSSTGAPSWLSPPPSACSRPSPAQLWPSARSAASVRFGRMRSHVSCKMRLSLNVSAGGDGSGADWWPVRVTSGTLVPAHCWNCTQHTGALGHTPTSVWAACVHCAKTSIRSNMWLCARDGEDKGGG